MAKEKKIKERIAAHALVHKFTTAVSLLSFAVITIVSLRLDAPLGYIINSIVYKSALVMLGISVVNIVVVQLLKTQEEMNRGEG